jgi:hypothetical protein
MPEARRLSFSTATKATETASITYVKGPTVIVMDFVVASAATWTPTSRKRPERQTRAGSVRAKSWSGFPGFGQMVPQGYAMASGAIMERSAGYRAGSAAGGTAMASRQRPADVNMSGMRRFTDLGRLVSPPPAPLAASGGKRNNAQQDANRRLPPGGNTGCRCSR